MLGPGGAYLLGSDLEEARLVGVDLRKANLSDANLGRADLHGANLVGANLTSSTLHGADLTDAILGWTIFGRHDLRSVIGLATAKHDGPSIVGVETLYMSEGQIPVRFLRGAGIPESLITYTASLVSSAISFHSCFISYSSHDGEFAERLHADLQAKGVRCWFAPEDLKTGDRFQERIEESIRLFDKVMIVLSGASVQSRWVEREVNAAREREHRENRTVLFPIRIDDAVLGAPQPWAADVRRSRHIGGFTRWTEHDAYTKALDRLLRDLRASEESA